MVPGISPPNTSSSLAANPARGEVFSVNGATQGASNTRIEWANGGPADWEWKQAIRVELSEPVQGNRSGRLHAG
jgi:hypothetical protein